MESAYAAIARLVFGYAERLDAGDLAGMAALFDGAHLRTASGDGVTFTGAAEVLAAFDGSVQRFEAGTPSTKHVTTNLIVDADDGRDRIGTGLFHCAEEPAVPAAAAHRGRPVRGHVCSRCRRQLALH